MKTLHRELILAADLWHVHCNIIRALIRDGDRCPVESLLLVINSAENSLANYLVSIADRLEVIEKETE